MARVGRNGAEVMETLNKQVASQRSDTTGALCEDHSNYTNARRGGAKDKAWTQGKRPPIFQRSQ